MTTTPPPPDGSDRSMDLSGLPAHPGTPAEESNRVAAALAQPSSVRLAVRLMRVGAALSLLGLVASLTTLDTLKSDIRDQLQKNDVNVTQAELDTAYNAAIAFAVIGALIGVALWLWMAWKNGEGRSWARIVATVLGGINVLTTLYALTAGRSTGLSIAVTVVNLVLAAVILVLIWRKESSDFYIARSRPQLG